MKLLISYFTTNRYGLGDSTNDRGTNISSKYVLLSLSQSEIPVCTYDNSERKS